jgi:Fur family zinc uptake transcriptional regulator
LGLHTHDVSDLTKNQNLVMTALSDAKGPLSAYTILDQLREHGFRAPLQVYRALDKLLEIGFVHKLESLNAYVACQHPSCDEQENVAFIICDNCGIVGEISSDKLSSQLSQLANDDGFSVRKSIIEIRGLCKTCRAA